jgi:hypothetical protein
VIRKHCEATEAPQTGAKRERDSKKPQDAKRERDSEKPQEWSSRQSVSGLNNFAELTTPAAPSRNGSILWKARPPLLFKEGNFLFLCSVPLCWAKQHE